MKAALTALMLAWTGGPADSCRLALSLALDVSGSVNADEYRLQVQGLAAALEDPEVQAAFLAIEGTPVALSIYEWSSSKYQRLIQDWIVIGSADALSSLASKVRRWQREPAPEATGLGAALGFGHDLIARAPACWQTTLDVSGDGENNDWPTPRDLKKQGELRGLRINGLVIAATDEGAAKLSAYFRAVVIQGPDAFVEVALGFDDYSRAMKRKLLKELATQPLGSRGSSHPLRLAGQ
ncbi:MAG: DUF1194 domain-containing protein [Silicimonas sp.]|nr:DUF1194 domain-containing protein [Silicimonas sp.]